MSKHDFTRRYTHYVEHLKAMLPYEDAMKAAVGTSFEGFSALELALLRNEGLHPKDYVIDVGCGVGRLTVALANYETERYLGTDVVPELLSYALDRYSRPAWRFELTDGLSIPEDESAADYVCFFSVFTHLLHEESYANLREAVRVLKPGGKVLFSFHEFRLHWVTFEANVAALTEEAMLNTFMDREGIGIWARNLGLSEPVYYDGNKRNIPVPHKLYFDHRPPEEGLSAFGQSVCVLSKP